MATILDKKRIFIVDDHTMVRDGIHFQLSNFPGLEVCGEGESVDEAFAQIKATRPHLVIIDLSLKDGHGLELVKLVKQHDPKIKMLV